VAARSLIAASDYSGQHSTSRFETLAFLLADGAALPRWLESRNAFRRTHLRDLRRMSFKDLNDRHRARALPHFLQLADCLQGILFVVVLDKRAGSFFNRPTHAPGATDLEFDLSSRWPAKSAEQLLRVCHFLALLLAGLSRDFQDVLWLTDQDDIAANEHRHRQLVQAFGRIASHYLQHTLGHLRIATTSSDTGKRDLEDLVAISDLAAGAVCHTMNAYAAAGISLPKGVTVPPPRGLPAKVAELMNWISDRRSGLKRFVVSIQPGENSAELLIGHVDFTGMTTR